MVGQALTRCRKRCLGMVFERDCLVLESLQPLSSRRGVGRRRQNGLQRQHVLVIRPHATLSIPGCRGQGAHVAATFRARGEHLQKLERGRRTCGPRRVRLHDTVVTAGLHDTAATSARVPEQQPQWILRIGQGAATGDRLVCRRWAARYADRMRPDMRCAKVHPRDVLSEHAGLEALPVEDKSQVNGASATAVSPLVRYRSGETTWLPSATSQLAFTQLSEARPLPPLPPDTRPSTRRPRRSRVPTPVTPPRHPPRQRDCKRPYSNKIYRSEEDGPTKTNRMKRH